MRTLFRTMTKAVLMLLIGSACLIGAPRASFAQACSQTLSAGANLSSAMSSAAPGSTLCLNSGSYGVVSLSNVVKNPRVTVRSVTGQDATFSVNTTNGANGFIFDSVTLTGWLVTGSTTRNITVRNTRFTGQANLSLCGVVSANLLIDASTFVDINVGVDSPEGRLHIAQPGCPGSQSVGVTVTNSLFENTGTGTVGESDGIQVGANGVVIGPGNIFRGIRQANFSRHVDALQLYGQSHTTITGNFFVNNTIDVGIYDGGSQETITNNVFNTPSGTAQHLQIGGVSTMTFTHNTFRNTQTISYSTKPENTANNNWLVQDNIFVNTDLVFGSGQQVCNNCTYNNNLFDAQSTQLGTNRILGSPTWVGGSSPSTLADFELAVGSLGKNAATDGQDVGANYLGPRTTYRPPTPPTNLRIVK